MVDKFYHTPPVNAPHYAKTIADICKNENVRILFPQMSAELPVFLREIDKFTAVGTEVSMTSNEGVNTANNKLKLYEFMELSPLSRQRSRNIKNISKLPEYPFPL